MSDSNLRDDATCPVLSHDAPVCVGGDGGSSGAAHLDWARVEQWTNDLLVGELQAIQETFRRYGALAPHVALSPSSCSIGPAPLRFVFEHWLAMKAPGCSEPPDVRSLNPAKLHAALGHVVLLDVLDGGRDFRYRLFGANLAWISGLDMTGRALSEHPSSPYNREFSIAAFRAIVRGRSALYSIRYPVGADQTISWHRIALPLQSGAGKIVQILGGTVPMGRDGRIVLT